MRPTLVLAASLVVSGCWSTYTRQELVATPAPLQRGFFMIATPRDGEYGTYKYPGSGRDTAWAVHSALLSYAERILIDENCATFECMKQTQDPGVTYDIVPEVLHWEDRNTGWSTVPDRISIRISVHDPATAKVLASAVVNGTSTRTEGTPDPSDLLDEPIRRYFKTLFPAPTSAPE